MVKKMPTERWRVGCGAAQTLFLPVPMERRIMKVAVIFTIVSVVVLMLAIAAGPNAIGVAQDGYGVQSNAYVQTQQLPGTGSSLLLPAAAVLMLGAGAFLFGKRADRQH
jgi:hypothetical protein